MQKIFNISVCRVASIKNATKIASLLLISLTIGSNAMAQTAYKVAGRPNVITLSGTSTLHAWAMNANSFSCNAMFVVAKSNQLSAVKYLTLTLPVANLKSESSSMNENAYKSLKSDQFKNITFVLTSAKVTSAGGNKYNISASGNLTIAGVTKPVTSLLKATINANGSISCSGGISLKFSSFNIERPSAVLGTVKAGDALSLKYSLTFIK